VPNLRGKLDKEERDPGTGEPGDRGPGTRRPGTRDRTGTGTGTGPNRDRDRTGPGPGPGPDRTEPPCLSGPGNSPRNNGMEWKEKKEK